MKTKHILTTTFTLICFMGFAQEKSMSQLIAEYLEVNGTTAQYGYAYDQMFDVLKMNYNGAEVPEKVWTEMKAEKEMYVNQIVTLLASSYRKHFDKADIQTMLTFYSSSAGQQMVQDPTKLNDEQKKAVMTFQNTQIGTKINEVRPLLEKDIAQTSEYWSRDLYSACQKSLEAKGYKASY